MFLIKIFHFLKGYVILSLWGHNKGEDFDRIVKSGIKIHDSYATENEIIVKVYACDFLKIRALHPKSKIRIVRKGGLGFLLRKTRKSFVIGLSLFLVLIALSSLFVWDISYEGVENTDIKKLQEATRMAGLYPGMLKFNIKSGYEMKDIILNNTDDIAWVWVYEKGTRIVVKVRENVLPPQLFDPDVPCDIVASRSGIIKSITTIRGKAQVTENQMVTPGDTLISGTYRFDSGDGYQVHSAGSIKAETEHVRSGIYKQNYCYKKYTGRQRRKAKIKLFGLEIPLYFGEKISFDEYDEENNQYDLKIKDNYLGVGISVKTAKEFVEEKEPIPYETMVDFAEKELEKKISNELLFGAELIDKKTETEKIDQDSVKVTVTMRFIEEIGTEKRIDEVTDFEPKTDRTSE